MIFAHADGHFPAGQFAAQFRKQAARQNGSAFFLHVRQNRHFNRKVAVRAGQFHMLAHGGKVHAL